MAAAREPTPDAEGVSEAPSPRLGFIVNPIAGMGGAVALKGTDGVLDEARQRGARPVAHDRAVRFLQGLARMVEVVTCAGPMGEHACREAGLQAQVLVDIEEPTTAQDTRQAARAMMEAGVPLIAFVGGDGTALDIAEAIDHELACLGIPSGVKMNSAVFAQTPEEGAAVATGYLAGFVEAEEREVVEIDEAALRAGALEPATLSSLLVPVHEAIQASKAEPGGTLEGVVEAARELAKPGSTMVIGPGSTMLAVKRALAGEGSLLGVDVLAMDEKGTGELIGQDVTARQLEEVPEDALLLVSPIGGQGFIIGRGNQQLSPGLLGRLGWERLRVLATSEKLRGLDELRVDTGDAGLDASKPARMDVLTGPGFRTRLPVR